MADGTGTEPMGGPPPVTDDPVPEMLAQSERTERRVLRSFTAVVLAVLVIAASAIFVWLKMTDGPDLPSLPKIDPAPGSSVVTTTKLDLFG